MNAINQLEPLAWDSAFFGFPVARLVARQLAPAQLAAALAAAPDLRLLYLFAAPDDAPTRATVAGTGAQLADEKATFALTLAAAPVVAPGPGHLAHANVFSPALEQLAWQSGEYSRFRRDPRFAPGAYERLYAEWLRQALAGRLARAVLTWAPTPDAPSQGLLTLGEKNGRADIGLLAVAAAARGRGVGQTLVAAARAQARAWGLAQLQVATQLANAPACAFYRRCGFALESVEHVYHLWRT